MSNSLIDSLANLAKSFLDQDQDIAFSFKGTAGDFKVISFHAHEAVNTPFEIHVELASDDANIDLHTLMDAPGVLGIHHKYDQPRYLHGIVTAAERGDSGIRRTFYTLTLEPTLSRLEHGSDSRIWQAKTVPEIVKEVLTEFGVPDVEWRLDATYQPREFLCQYRETHRAFIERILAEEGIFYYFEHSSKAHKLIFSDAPFAMPALKAAPKLAYNPRPGGASKGFWISHFSQRERLRASNYTMNDYTFHNPPANFAKTRAAQENNGLKGDYKLYDFPGRYKDPDKVGDGFTKHRIESIRVDATTANGQTNSIQLSAGYQFALIGHDQLRANGMHRLLSVSHSGQQSAALEEDAGSAPTTYSASFICQPGRLPYRPPLARKPVVDGPQIAMVTGPAGEEIYCDEHGRVRLHFYWDRYSKKDEHSSCWVRVSQNWAGGSWGHVAIPRIGHEVVVDFLEGDIDQPIITGRTYHAANKPPYPLPDNKTRMTIKSQTHKGQGYNELRFEDEAGQEEVFMHAQKDHNTVIENDESHQIGHDRSKNVGNDQSESIGHDKTISVGNDHSETISHNETLSVGNDAAYNITNDLSHTIGRDVMYKVGRNQQEDYGKDHVYNVGNILKENIHTDHLETIGGHYKGQINGEMKLEVGTSIETNTAVHKLMAGDTFEITGPGGKITIDSAGITLEASKIDLKGAVSMGGSGSAQVPTLDFAVNEAKPICEECEKKKKEG